MLRSKIWHSALALTVTAAMLPLSSAHAAKYRDEAVCYKVDYSNDRIVLDVKKHSDLTTFGLNQTVYDALGKHTQNFGYKQTDNYMAVAHGAVVVAKKNYYQPYFRSGSRSVESFGRAPDRLGLHVVRRKRNASDLVVQDRRWQDYRHHAGQLRHPLPCGLRIKRPLLRHLPGWRRIHTASVLSFGEQRWTARPNFFSGWQHEALLLKFVS